jgi:hypothetical protein
MALHRENRKHHEQHAFDENGKLHVDILLRNRCRIGAGPKELYTTPATVAQGSALRARPLFARRPRRTPLP